MQLAGRSVLLTGATGGLGHALALALAARGARLVLSGRRTDVLEALAARTGAQIAAADLAEPDAAARLAAEHPGIDVLVANAALPGSGRLEGLAPRDVDRALEVNLRAPIVLAHGLLPAMRRAGAGHLVFISSLSGKAATQGSSIYNATKFGLRGFAGALRAELHGTGVGVSTIFPGFVREAGMFADSGARLPRGVGTVSPQQVADATVGAIEHDRGEVDVAPLGLRLGAAFSAVAPEVAARAARRLGGAELASRMADGQADKR